MTFPLAFIEDVAFDVTSALQVPVLLAALLALAACVIELGALAAELLRRRRRDPDRLERAALAAGEALTRGNRPAAQLQLDQIAASDAMRGVLTRILDAIDGPRTETRLSKALADFDVASLRRLERTRMLVRAGPALGLMGTLIPLSPALEGLAGGDVAQLSANLRVAFSITVVGLLTGAIAFAISLVRDRLYTQDFSDLEFVAATLTEQAVEEHTERPNGAGV